MNPKDLIHSSWSEIAKELNYGPLYYLNTEVLPGISYQPPKDKIFRVFKNPLSNVRVVILGQDPYPTPGNANGLAFAVNAGNKIPKSLEIIQKELSTQYPLSLPYAGDWQTLEHWEEQGVLLLNTALTVETGKAGSHLEYWQTFMQHLVHFISLNQPCIWVLWGRMAQKYSMYIKNPLHVRGYTDETISQIPVSDDYNYIFTAPHPAAEAYGGGNAGFYGNKHFIYTNKILELKAQKQIQW